MTLSKEAYQAFEDIVGTENISDDPALLDSYIYPLTATSIHLGPWFRKFTPRSSSCATKKHRGGSSYSQSLQQI